MSGMQSRFLSAIPARWEIQVLTYLNRFPFISFTRIPGSRAG